MKFYQTKDAQLIKRWIQVTEFLFTLSEKAGGQRGDRALSDSQLSASSVMSTLLLVHNSFPSSVQALSTTPHIRFLLSKDSVGAQLFPLLCSDSFPTHNSIGSCSMFTKDSVGAQHFLLLSSTLFLLRREGSRLFRTTLLRSRALSEAIQSNTMRCRVT